MHTYACIVVLTRAYIYRKSGKQPTLLTLPTPNSKAGYVREVWGVWVLFGFPYYIYI